MKIKLQHTIPKVALLFEGEWRVESIPLAKEVGIYTALMAPHEIGLRYAKQLAPLLSLAIRQLKKKDSTDEKVKRLLAFLELYKEACIDFPYARISR